jgi:hypothetical protein
MSIWLTRLIVVIFFIAIVGSLASGLFSLMRDRGGTERTVRALTIRVALSITLFVLLMLAGALGLITPHGL